MFKRKGQDGIESKSGEAGLSGAEIAIASMKKRVVNDLCAGASISADDVKGVCADLDCLFSQMDGSEDAQILTTIQSLRARVSTLEGAIVHKGLVDEVKGQTSFVAEVETFLSVHDRVERATRRKEKEHSFFSRMRRFSAWILGQSSSRSRPAVQQIESARFAAGRWSAGMAVAVLLGAMGLAHWEAKCAFDFATGPLIPKGPMGPEMLTYQLNVFIARMSSITLMGAAAVWFAIKSLGIAKELFTPLSASPLAAPEDTLSAVEKVVEKATDELIDGRGLGLP